MCLYASETLELGINVPTVYMMYSLNSSNKNIHNKLFDNFFKDFCKYNSLENKKVLEKNFEKKYILQLVC